MTVIMREIVSRGLLSKSGSPCSSLLDSTAASPAGEDPPVPVRSELRTPTTLPSLRERLHAQVRLLTFEAPSQPTSPSDPIAFLRKNTCCVQQSSARECLIRSVFSDLPKHPVTGSAEESLVFKDGHEAPLVYDIMNHHLRLGKILTNYSTVDLKVVLASM